MHIRNMTKQDYVVVNEIMKEVHEIHVKNRPDLYVDIENPCLWETFVKDIENENIISILAENEEVLGICFVSFREKTCMVNQRTAYMDDLCVRERWRGKGIGTKLFQCAKEEAKKKGAERLDLMVWEFNKNAFAFYKKMNMHVQRSIMEVEM